MPLAFEAPDQFQFCHPVIVVATTELNQKTRVQPRPSQTTGRFLLLLISSHSGKLQPLKAPSSIPCNGICCAMCLGHSLVIFRPLARAASCTQKSLTIMRETCSGLGNVVWSTFKARGKTPSSGVCFYQGSPWPSNLPRIQRGIRLA